MDHNPLSSEKSAHTMSCVVISRHSVDMTCLLSVVLSQTALLDSLGFGFLVMTRTCTQYLVWTSRLDSVTRFCWMLLMVVACREQQRVSDGCGGTISAQPDSAA